MSKTYLDIQKQIQALSREAEKLKRKEVEGVIARIRDAIQTYGLTAADLGLTGPGRKGRAAAAKRGKAAAGVKRAGRKAAGEVKFRDESGNVWGGRGPRPKWLREALAGGRKLEDFAV